MVNFSLEMDSMTRGLFSKVGRVKVKLFKTALGTVSSVPEKTVDGKRRDVPSPLFCCYRHWGPQPQRHVWPRGICLVSHLLVSRGVETPGRLPQQEIPQTRGSKLQHHQGGRKGFSSLGPQPCLIRVGGGELFHPISKHSGWLPCAIRLHVEENTDPSLMVHSCVLILQV